MKKYSLHIALFGPLQEEPEAVIQALGRDGFGKIACNHCTDAPAVVRMRELGYPVAEGRGRPGAEGPPFIGNGDTVEFGGALGPPETKRMSGFC